MNVRSIWNAWLRHRQLIDAGLCALLAIVGWRLQTAGHDYAILVFILAYFFGGYQAFWNGLATLRERSVDVDLLMIVAALGAASVGYWEDGATLLFLFCLSNALQVYAMQRTRHAISRLLDLRPEAATVVRNGQEVLLPLEEIEPGDRVLIKPGERIPMDGTVLSGESQIDQSAITGESMPVYKQPGDVLFAGTVNHGGFLEMAVTKRSHESTLARIIHLVEEAQQKKARSQRFLERLEQIYTMVILLITAAAVAIPVALGSPFDQAFYRAMTLLVVASPCALVMGTPAAVLSSIAHLARRGVLVKGGAFLENLAAVRWIAFDKTGTLTTGKPQVTHLVPADGVTEEELLLWTASMEQRAEHPFAESICQLAQSRSLKLLPTEELQAHSGKGIVGSVSGRMMVIGNRRFLAEHGIQLGEEWESAARPHEQAGHTPIFIARDGQLLGIITLQDRPREQAAVMLHQLSRMGIGRHVMLSGDHPEVARIIGRQVGIEEVYGGLSPEDKVKWLEKLQQQHGPAAMVGDGVNDAPALAAASIGVAMGAAGTDVALETADMVLMGDDLDLLPYAIEHSKRTRSIVLQNITFALAVIVVLVGFTLAGHLTLPLAVIGHEGSTIIVIGNGLRLLAVPRLHKQQTGRQPLAGHLQGTAATDK